MLKFNKYFKPSPNCKPASGDIIAKYKNKVPELLIEIWKTTGLGKYNDGIIELVNPEEYEQVLWTWLGREILNYVPFAISGFGELFYYRKLTETEEDVCLIDIQYRKIEVLVWSMTDFFEDFLTNEEDRAIWLREELFRQALTKLGKINSGEIFTIVPALAIGGAEDLENLQKGKAQVYQYLVFEMTS